MNEAEVHRLLESALHDFNARDTHLLANDLNERCIAARLGFYLQNRFPDFCVDVEYNRHGDTPKRLNLPPQCANARDENGQALVVPDIIIHRRGPEGPNLLVIEVKKTTNPELRDCDRGRVVALREQLGYSFGALVECATRTGEDHLIRLTEWFA